MRAASKPLPSMVNRIMPPPIPEPPIPEPPIPAPPMARVRVLLRVIASERRSRGVEIGGLGNGDAAAPETRSVASLIAALA